MTKFNGVHSVDLHIPRNFGADFTKIHFIAFKGEHTQARVLQFVNCMAWSIDSELLNARQVKREAVATVYEAKPLVADHKVPGSEQLNFHQIS